MPGSSKGSKPGSRSDRTRQRPGGASRADRLRAFRDVMYTRMEEISFRTSMTVLAAVVAFAGVLAAVSVLMSLPPGVARHTAAGLPARPPSASAASAPATRTPESPSASPAQPTPSRVRDAPPAAKTAAPVTAAAAVPRPTVPTPTLSPALARVSYQSAAAAWWAWWTRVHDGGSLRFGGTGGIGAIGGYGGGFGGFGFGGGRMGRR
jgi:hypothetical protein